MRPLIWATRLGSIGSLPLFIGLGIAGLGQFVFGLLPATSLTASDLEVLVLWQSLSFGVGLILASPINNVLYSELVRHDGLLDDPVFRTLFWRVARLTSLAIMIVNALAIGVITSVVESSLWVALLLAISVDLQLVGAAQRAVFAGQSKWIRLSSQFVIEGTGRVCSTVIVMSLFGSNLITLLLSNVLVQLLAILGSGFRVRWCPRWISSPLEVNALIGLFISPFLAALALQSFFTLTPLLSRVIGGATSLQVALIGGAIQIVRIPVTFSSPMVLPRLNELASYFNHSDRQRGFSVVRIATVRLLVIWGVFGILVSLGVLLIPNDTVEYQDLISPSLLLVIVLACMAGPVAVFLHSTMLILDKRRALTCSWILAMVAYLVVLKTIGDSGVGAVFSILIGTATVSMALAWSLRSDEPQTTAH
jgi:hypothetical protein